MIIEWIYLFKTFNSIKSHISNVFTLTFTDYRVKFVHFWNPSLSGGFGDKNRKYSAPPRCIHNGFYRSSQQGQNSLYYSHINRSSSYGCGNRMVYHGITFSRKVHSSPGQYICKCLCFVSSQILFNMREIKNE